MFLLRGDSLQETVIPMSVKKIKQKWCRAMKDSIIIPIWEKSNLTVEEAAAYSNIGINKLREITNDHRCEFVLWVGNKRLIKRKLFDKYIENSYSI